MAPTAVATPDQQVHDAIVRMASHGSLPEEQVLISRLSHLCSAEAVTRVLYDMQMSSELITVGCDLILNNRFIPRQRSAV